MIPCHLRYFQIIISFKSFFIHVLSVVSLPMPSPPPQPSQHTYIYSHICIHAHTAHHVNGCSPQHFFAAAIGILIHSHKEVHKQGIQRLPKKKSMIKGWVSIPTFLEQGGKEWGNYGLTVLPGLYVQRVFDVLSGNISRQHLSLSVTLFSSYCSLSSKLFKKLRIINKCNTLSPSSCPRHGTVGRKVPAGEWNWLLTQWSCPQGCLCQVKDNHPFPRALESAAAAPFKWHKGKTLLWIWRVEGRCHFMKSMTCFVQHFQKKNKYYSGEAKNWTAIF